MSIWSNQKRLDRLKKNRDDNSPPSDCSETCKHVWYYDGGDHLCQKCYLVGSIPCYEKDLNCNYEFWPRNYDRLTYFQKIFGIISGHPKLYISDQSHEELIREIGELSDWYHVYQIFKKFDLKDWWTSWIIMSDNPRRIHDHAKPYHFSMVYYVDNHYIEDTKRKKKKMNVLYVLYKIVELYNDNVSWVPFKLRSSSIERLDEEWKIVCKCFGWKFIPTCKTLKKFDWNDNEI